jgi:hypothetical protein
VLAHAGAADESLAIGMVFAALWVGWIGWSRRRGTGFERLPAWAGPGLIVAGVIILAASTVVPRAIFGPTSSLPTPGTGPRIASTARLAIEQPRDGAVAHGRELDVVLDLQGGRVVEATTRDVTPDTGHIHLSVDGTLVSMTYGTVQVVDLRPYGPGEHELSAEFVAADHAPFAPPVIATVTFDMAGDGP